MPTKNPHVYATRTPADLQEANPKNPNFKGKADSKKPKKTHGKADGVRSKFRKLAKSRKSSY